MVRVPRLLVSASAALLLLLAASGSVPVAAASGSQVSFALAPGSSPNYIFPLMNSIDASNANIFDLQYQLFRPLYWFGDQGRTTVNYAFSLGKPPTYSDSGRTVTVSLKHYLWSDGVPVTNRDVEFWMNMIIANKDNWYAYTPGAFPDDVTSMSFPASSPYTFSITFNKAYNHVWLLSNELSQIIPMPQQAWDRTSASSPEGDYDETSSGALAVYHYLDGQSQTLSTYATNPLWKVVDGPWRLSAYSPETGYSAFVPNPGYSGPAKPHIASFVEEPFTSATSEFDALRSGSLDYGYLPINDLDQRSQLSRLGYQLEPWTVWGINYVLDNFTNPKTGPLFKQLYFREAMQRLVNQPEMIRDVLHGEGYPTYGPVPIHPASPYVTSAERSNPYPYSVAAAKSLLSDHGWAVHAGGTDSCSRPGSGARDCGAGIKRGMELRLTLVYTTGSAVFDDMMQELRSAYSLAGIDLTLQPSASSQVFTELSPCQPKTGFGCHWDLIAYGDVGYAYTYSPDFYPSGDEIFATGAGSNFNGYSDARADQLIRASYSAPGLEPLFRYENYLTEQLPVVWIPNIYYQLSEIKSSLHGAVPQDPNLNIYPQEWSVS